MCHLVSPKATIFCGLPWTGWAARSSHLMPSHDLTTQVQAHQQIPTYSKWRCLFSILRMMLFLSNTVPCYKKKHCYKWINIENPNDNGRQFHHQTHSWLNHDILTILNGKAWLAMEVKISDLMECCQLNSVYLFNPCGVLDKSAGDSCIGTLYSQQHDSILSLCTMELVDLL